MAVPSSGELKLWDSIWNQEIGGSKGENSLHSASIYAGFTTPDALSDFYGWSDVEVPTVVTNSSTSVAWNTLTANGNITATGNENPSRGFYIGTNSSAATNNPKYTLSGTQGTGTFSYTYGTSQNTTYYIWAWACNSAGESTGARVTTSTPVRPFTPSLAAVNNAFSSGFAGTGQASMQTLSYYHHPYNGSNITMYNDNTSTGAGQGNFRNYATNTQNGSRQHATGCESACMFLYNYDASSRMNSRNTSISLNAGGNNANSAAQMRSEGSKTGGTNANPYGTGQILHCFILSSDIKLKTNITYL